MNNNAMMEMRITLMPVSTVLRLFVGMGLLKMGKKNVMMEETKMGTNAQSLV